MLCQFFALRQGILPDKYGIEFTRKYDNFWFWPGLLQLIWSQLRVSWRLGIDVLNPFTFLFDKGYALLNIVTVFPEFQPRRDLFDSSYRFVGNCISESVRTVEINDEKLKQVLAEFEPVNPAWDLSRRGSQNLKLVYVSLGTIFNNNLFVFEKIINAVRIFDSYSSMSGLRRQDLRVVFALGNATHSRFMHKISNEAYEVPENTVLLASAPQIELLKRASLFVTHCGMGSSSEAVHYAVPVICVPMQIDQPLNARRLAELRLGKQFADPLKLSADEMCRAMHECLGDQAYSERMVAMAKISRQHDGSVNGCRLIMETLASEQDKKLN